MQFCDFYPKMLDHVLNQGRVELNERTGHETAVSQSPISFAIDMSTGILPVPGNRKVFPGTAAAEVAWFMAGDKDPTWLRKYCKIWDQFIEDDGTVGGAYGYRWRHHFGRDQIALAVKRLREQPSDRQVVISAWDPASDGLGTSTLKNIPCPAFFQLTTVGGFLNLVLYIRSSDMFVGLPYDVMGYAFIMDAFAKELGLQRGLLHVTLAHPHIYDSHWDAAAISLKSLSHAAIQVPGWSISEIEADPDGYVATVKASQWNGEQSPFNPRPEIVQ